MKKLLIAMVVMAAATTVLAQGVSRPLVRSRRLENVHEANRCKARIVRVLGLDNDYFRDTELFKSGQASPYSTEVVLNEPFGPFNKARCSLMTRTPSVVDVTTEDRSNATNALPRYFMERVTLSRDYDRETTAEDLEGELKKVVDQLNGIFGCQLVSPVLSPVDDEDKKQEESKSKLRRQLRRPLMGVVFGAVSPLSVFLELKGQRIDIAAYEPVFCKRDGIVKLKMPAMMSMTIHMNQQFEMNHGLDDGDVDVKPVVLGADNVKAFSGAFSQAKGVGANFGRSRSPAQYEYNRDTKRIVRGLDVDGSLVEDSLRRERQAEREEQRKQLMQIREELRKVREARTISKPN